MQTNSSSALQYELSLNAIIIIILNVIPLHVSAIGT